MNEKNLMKSVIDSHGHSIYYIGPEKEKGPLPAFFYFALSGEESLNLHPYNSVVAYLSDLPLRIFSFNIPGHGDNFNRFLALSYWAEQMERGIPLLEDFFQKTLYSIQWLIGSHLVDPEHMATGGLSRGGFIAAHIAARDSRIKTVLGLAPLTVLSKVQEFSESESDLLQERAGRLNLIYQIPNLLHVKNLLFYIGNRDMRVSTDACYHFIREMAEEAHQKRARHCHIEMRITPSIGHKGHGTAPHIFKEGALWVKNHLLGSS